MEVFILFIRFDAVGVDSCCFGNENHHVYGSKKNVAVYTSGDWSVGYCELVIEIFDGCVSRSNAVLSLFGQ